MNCPYCKNKLNKTKNKYKCERCHKSFTYWELQIHIEGDYLDKHKDTVDRMEGNNGVNGNY